MTARPERIPPGRAAQICGVSRKTLLRLAEAGKIPGAAPLEDGRLWRFDEAALRRWLRQREGSACPTTSIDYLKRGGSIYTLQQILGHSSIKTTEIYLAFLAPEAAKRGTA